jgi:hypothetical protein
MGVSLPWSGDAAEGVQISAQGVGGDLAGASDVDGLELAGGEELVELGAADAECCGGFGDGVDEPLAAVGLLSWLGGDRDRLLSVGW